MQRIPERLQAFLTNSLHIVIHKFIPCVICSKLVSSLMHHDYDDTFMSYIYSSDFKLQTEPSDVFNIIQMYSIKITSFSVLPYVY